MRILRAALIIILIAGCGKGEVETEPYAKMEDVVTTDSSIDTLGTGWDVAQSFEASGVIDALNDDDSPVRIVVGPRTIAMQMATWCPFSRQVVDFLNDPAVRSRRAAHDFVFVFRDSEWPDIERKLEEAVAAGDLDTVDLPGQLTALKENAGYARVYDPEFLDLLPEGSKYYFLAKDSPVWGKSYPLVYDKDAQQFSQKSMGALGAALFYEHEAEDFVELWLKHLPEAERERLNVTAAEIPGGR